MIKIMKRLFLILILFCSVSAIYSQTADEIISKFYEATNQQKLQEYNTVIRKTISKAKVKASEYEVFDSENNYKSLGYIKAGSTETYAHYLSINGMVVYNFKKGWQRANEPMEIGTAIRAYYRGTIPNDLSQWEINYMGEKENCYLLEMKKDKVISVFYFDKKTYFVKKMETTLLLTNPISNKEIRSVSETGFSAYKSFNEIKLPTIVTVLKTNTEVTDYWFDAELPGDFFEPSDEVGLTGIIQEEVLLGNLSSAKHFIGEK